MNSIIEIGRLPVKRSLKSARSSIWATVSDDVSSRTSVMSIDPSHSVLGRISRRSGSSRSLIMSRQLDA